MQRSSDVLYGWLGTTIASTRPPTLEDLRDRVRLDLPTPDLTPGIFGPSYFRTNALGTRGPMPNGERTRLLDGGEENATLPRVTK